MVKAGLITGFKIKLEEIPGADVLSCLWKLWLSAFCIGFLIMRKKKQQECVCPADFLCLNACRKHRSHLQRVTSVLSHQS